ncbi:MAG: LysE family translocator [Pseudomonadota bacterium]
MVIEVWLTYLAATLALLAVPGPVVMLLLGYTMAGGRSVAAAAIPGVVFGDLTAMTVSLLGAGAILQASTSLFIALKVAGAAYLVWLGFRMWKTGAAPATFKISENKQQRMRISRDAFLVTALNPKDILFFVAFLPQFIDPALPILPQIVILEATFGALVLVSTVIWILLAAKATDCLRHPSTRSLVSRIGASWLIGAAVVTAVRA